MCSVGSVCLSTSDARSSPSGNGKVEGNEEQVLLKNAFEYGCRW